ncbi:MAG: VWA domain-containing protein, partial [Thermoanaerobaculia bacterium]
RPTAGGIPTSADQRPTEAEVAPEPPPETEVEIPDEQRLHLVVYIDNFNIRPFNRNRVFRRLREFLNELGRDDRVMLVTYDRSLHYRHPFTNDAQLISQALFEIETMTGSAVHQDSDRRDLLRQINEADSISNVLWNVRTFAESAYNDLSFSVDAMREIVDSLAGLPGRKALLYVSDGLSMQPGEEMFYMLLQKFNETSVMSTAQEFNASRLFESLASQANANRVAFYTIDAAGLRPPSASSVEVAEISQAGLTTFYDQTLISNLQAPLLTLAERTGGKAIINTNDVGPALDDVSRGFRNYYSLGFTPNHSGSGRQYDVEVRVKGRKDLVVRHRQTYRDKPVESRISDGTMATLLYGETRNPLNINLAMRDSVPDVQEDGYYLVTVVVEIPIREITLLPREDMHVGRARVFFVAMDEEGGLSEVQETPVDLRIPNDRIDEALGQLYPFQVQLRMRSGPHRLAVGVLDEVGAEAAYVARAFVVGQA